MKKSEILTTLINQFFSFDAEKGNHESLFLFLIDRNNDEKERNTYNSD